MLRTFMENRSGMDVIDILNLMFAYAVILLLVLPVHELAHAGAAYALGDKTAKWQGRLSLNPFKHLDLWGSLMILTVGIGYAKPVPVNPYNLRHGRRDMALVSLAGPLSNLLMAVVTVGLFRLILEFSPEWDTVEILWNILINTIVSINISLAVFNLLPIPPLDGSRLWSSLLPGRWAYTIEAYSQYITIALFIVLFMGVLDGPLNTLHSAVFDGLDTLFGVSERLTLLFLTGH